MPFAVLYARAFSLLQGDASVHPSVAHVLLRLPAWFCKCSMYGCYECGPQMAHNYVLLHLPLGSPLNLLGGRSAHLGAFIIVVLHLV